MATISASTTRPARLWKLVRKGMSISAGIVAALLGVGWAGISVMPAPFPTIPGGQTAPATVPLPAGLPAPVDRYFRQRYGDEVPIVNTVIVSGRGTMRMKKLLNLSFPVRYRFSHVTGQSYRHYIEMTFFGIPFVKVNEWYVDGVGRMEVAGSVKADDPGWNQGANLALWLEAFTWFPSILVTDPRVQWTPIDDATALMTVPFGDKKETVIVRFDPESGDLTHYEMFRYNDDEGEKQLYINGTWFEDGRPWFALKDVEVALNVDVDILGRE